MSIFDETVKLMDEHGRRMSSHPVLDITLREYNGEWLPIITYGESELYRGEYHTTPEEALSKAIERFAFINKEKQYEV